MHVIPFRALGWFTDCPFREVGIGQHTYTDIIVNKTNEISQNNYNINPLLNNTANIEETLSVECINCSAYN